MAEVFADEVLQLIGRHYGFHIVPCKSYVLDRR